MLAAYVQRLLRAKLQLLICLELKHRLVTILTFWLLGRPLTEISDSG